MNAPVLSAFAGLGVLALALLAVLVRFGTRVHDNTAAVERLTAAVEGSTNVLGLNARVRDLEGWRIKVETEQRVTAEIQGKHAL